MIRAASEADAADICALLTDAWSTMPYARERLDADLLAAEVAQHIADDHRRAWVSDVSGRIRGVLLAERARGTANETAMVCRSGEGAALVRQLVRWAGEIGASEATIGVSSGSERAVRLIERMGFVRQGDRHRRTT